MSDATSSQPLPDGLWIVIAAYNEQRRIGAVLDGLLAVTKNIVVVNDGSRDDTAGEVLKRPVVAGRSTPSTWARAPHCKRELPSPWSKTHATSSPSTPTAST